MHLSQLSLTNVRSFRRLDIELRPGAHVVTGPNGSGKSNLLEAIALLATTRSARASNDADLISWAALEDEALPVARMNGHVVAAGGPVTVEVVVGARAAAGAGGCAGRDAPLSCERRREACLGPDRTAARRAVLSG